MTDELKDLDLHAWQPPPVPPNLVDSVINRMTATDEAIAASVRKRRFGYLRVAAMAVGGVAAGLAGWLAIRPGPAPEVDVVVALAPRTIQLGDTSVELDRGTVLSTSRVGGHLSAVQSGTATWHVAPHDQLEIGAGSSASINAAGSSSLRVESSMNTNTGIALVMGGVALTAASVALVSATVFEGHVEGHDGGRVVLVEPSTTTTVGGGRIVTRLAPSPPPAPPLAAHESELAIAPGESAVIYTTDGRVSVEVQKQCVLRVEIHGVEKNGHETIVSVGSADNGVNAFELMTGKHKYYARCATETQDVVGTLDVRLDTCRGKYCGDDRLVKIFTPMLGATFGDTVRVTGHRPNDVAVWIGGQLMPDPKDAIVSIDDGSHEHWFDATLEHKENQSVVLRAQTSTRLEFYVQHSAVSGTATLAKPKAACDADADVELGKQYATMDFTSALKYFESAYACRPELRTAELAFMTACNMKDVAKARAYWSKLSASAQAHDITMCVREGITRATLDAKISVRL